MEKLLEVLIAIGDEVACLSVAELILRHWPSHSRALHVKKVIEESEPVPFSPRGIDKLEPKHVRLKFLDKRKATDGTLDDSNACKKLKQDIELPLAEASWSGLADALLEVLRPLNSCNVEKGADKAYLSGDVRLVVQLPSSSESTVKSEERKGLEIGLIYGNTSLGDSNTEVASNVKEKDTNILEEQPQERRSSRLRSRKPGKEDLDFANGKDQAKVVIQYLESFISSEPGSKDTVCPANFSSPCHNQVNHCDVEHHDVSRFIERTTNNYGAYHLGHMFLEEAASRGLVYQDAFIKFLELEKMTRHWGKDRTPECSLFLSELYYDLGSSFSDASSASEFMSEASYHVCKIIESVALVYPLQMSCVLGDESSSWMMRFQGTGEISASKSGCPDLPSDSLSLINNSSFWIRFFWLSGRLSILEGNKEKAHEEFCISLSLLEKESVNDSQFMIFFPHCKVVKEITVDRVLHEINILKIDFLMEKSLKEMIAKEMYTECITLLAPLLFSTKDVHLDSSSLHFSDKEGEGITYVELSALDILVKACEKTKPMDVEVYLNCHRRKLQILMAIAGIDECLASCKSTHWKSISRPLSTSDIGMKDASSKRWNSLVYEEVKAVSNCVSQVKHFIDQSVSSVSTHFLKFLPSGSATCFCHL